MTRKISRAARAASLMMLLMGATALVATPTPWDIAEAKGGNNGGGNNGGGNDNGNRGGGNDNGNRGGHRNASANAGHEAHGNNGRGVLARELRRLNGAHASRRALERAAPNSTPGLLNTYRTEYLDLVDAHGDFNDAQREFDRLSNLTDEEIAAEFADQAAYDTALGNAERDLIDATNDLGDAQDDANRSLGALTGGRQLSQAAMDELHRLLGL